MTDEEFERELAVLLNSVSLEKRKRLEALQWKCDQIKRKHGDNHVGSAVELSKLMLDSLVQLTDVLENGKVEDKDITSKVIKFSPKKDDNNE